MTLFDDDQTEEKSSSRSGSGPTTLHLYDDPADPAADGETPDEPFVISPAEPEPYSETVRRSGLAWSAGGQSLGSGHGLFALGLAAPAAGLCLIGAEIHDWHPYAWRCASGKETHPPFRSNGGARLRH